MTSASITKLQTAPGSETFKFSQKEEEILEFWKKNETFKTSIELNKDKPRFTFYDGPPFATGLPHYGHLLAGTIKDVVTRYAHQSGHYVERRFGWDCHGLPVEFEIDQTLGIKGPEDVARMGIAAYNKECRGIVDRYSSEWEKIVSRMGRWIDFKNDYKTMYPEFMESVWWVFKQLHSKGLVYRGFKVMPYSTACSTPLSNFESGQNFKEVSDPSVIVNFPILSNDGSITGKHLLAWTTTPWTLPSNLALCINSDMDYLEFQVSPSGPIYIAMESRLEFILKKNYQNQKDFKILDKFKGEKLVGLHYKPLFDYFTKFKETGAFRVVSDAYVSSDAGTGIVHQAPFFGEDDHRVCIANGIIKKDVDLVCPLDPKGRFTELIYDFKNEYIKDADKNIIKNLRQKGRLFKEATLVHSYPFCWRSDTPLIYRTIPSWFIRVEPLKEKLIEHNQTTYWVPEYVREGRFANWLKNARDWAVSRNRYWGTPIPLWVSDDYEEIVCIGSVEELKKLSGVSELNDLHREHVDQITIPSKLGKGQLKRVSEVFDCWFESGSMPYAQQHYPFENRDKFEQGFPADFIAEGIDQTRGWFYTLLVVSVGLFDKAPFKNLIANGLVLASDGQKMSKRKKNYPDSTEVMASYSADALRLYLITSPAVRAENLKFREEGVKDVLKDVIIPWYNAYRFFTQNVHVFEQETNSIFVPQDLLTFRPQNILDKWILSFTQSLIKFVKKEMAIYHLYTVVPKLVKFVENLTNWYVRVNRLRLKNSYGESESKAALSTLYHVLLAMVRLMAPFTPFITEILFQNLKNLLPDLNAKENESVHFQAIPNVVEDHIDEAIERKVHTMQRVIELARVIRDRKTLPLKYPLAEIVVISRDKIVETDLKDLESYVLSELNVKKLVLTDDKEKYGIKIKAEADIRSLGARLKGESRKVIEAIKALDELSLQEYQNDPDNFTISGHKLVEGELKLVYLFETSGDRNTQKSDSIPSRYEAHSDGNVVVLLDVLPDQSMLDEGLAREFVNRIQKLRKKGNLVPTDSIVVEYFIENIADIKESLDLCRIIDENKESISSVVRSQFILRSTKLPTEALKDEIIRDTQKLKNSDLEIAIRKQ